MRHIVLSDDGFNVADDAHYRLLVTGHFPESPRDREQGLFIAALERAEFNRVGQDHYRPSEITRAASRLLEKRAARVYLVGFVALSFIWLKSAGQIPSLNRASAIASCVANEFGKIGWYVALNPTGGERETAVTSDPSSVEKIFRKYRSVAHIWAANVSASDHLAVLHLWDQTPEVTGSLIQTCAALQMALEVATDVSAWNLWDVRKHFPASLNDFPVLIPDNDLLSWIERGHEIAIAEGLIKRQRGGS